MLTLPAKEAWALLQGHTMAQPNHPTSNLSRSELSLFVFVFVLVWSGRELGWAVYVCFSMLVFEFGLVWFSIRGSCQLLSLIENHT